MNHRGKHPLLPAQKAPVPASTKTRAAPPARTTQAQLRELERAAGNRTVNQMLAQRPTQVKQNSASVKTSPQPREPLPQPSAIETPRFSVGDHALQEKADGVEGIRQESSSAAQRANRTGIPDELKAGIESLSGMSLDHVKVHYNSSQPAQVNALAYAQGGDIHVAPGQEQHLPHEAWHVVQQAQGRVKPTMQMKDGVSVNDDEGLEREADVMGARALGHSVQVQGASKRHELLHGQCARPERESVESQAAQRRSVSPGQSQITAPGQVDSPLGASVEFHVMQRGLTKGPRVLQAKGLPVNWDPLGFDIAYSIAPKQDKQSSRLRPSGPDVLQRLIVVDDDLDTSRLMAAVRIYYKHSNELITTIHKAKDVKLSKDEKIYMVAHGAGKDHGGRSAKDLAAILKTWGLHSGSSVIKLISCFSGKDAPEWSYANELALQLDFMYKVVGIKGLESTDEKGHTRATEQLVDDKTFEKAYFETLEDDDSFQKAEKVTQEVKSKIKTCKLGEEAALMVEAYKEVNVLCQGVFKKLEGALKGMIKDKGKSESEDVMTPI